jgi:ABC-type sulfate transport system permease component
MMQAIGMLGLILMAAFTAALVWLLASWGWLDVSNATAMTWVVQAALGLILGVGMSWAIVRQRLTGQASVDDIDDKD